MSAVLFTTAPTAKQFVALVHDTPASALSAPPGALGLGTIDQDVPFQRSINVFVAALVWKLPTAKQVVALTHDMADRALSDDPDNGGAIDQVLPFHVSANDSSPMPASTLPTVRQLLALAHETSASVSRML